MINWRQRLTDLVELSIALVRSEALSIPLVDVDKLDQPMELLGTTSCYTCKALLICGEVVNICWGGTGDLRETPPQPRTPWTLRWHDLFGKLETWYSDRPSDFLPIVELENGQGHGHVQGEAFPVIIFSNAAGIFGNQLYHTAMLLLLHHKPRSLRQSIRSLNMSPLWHLERVCGIALNNKRRECWDPTLLASLLSAARRLTHQSQQRALYAGLDRVQVLTGFDVRTALNTLRSSWTYSASI